MAHIYVIPYEGMGDAKRSSRHPSQGLFYDTPNIREVGLIVKTRDAIAAYSIKLSLSRLPYFGENDHCLHKSHKGISRCFEAGLKD